MAKPFIPRDKPKSWVVGVCAGLLGVLVFGPLALLGHGSGLSLVGSLGVAGFIICWVVVMAMGAVFLTKMVSGSYRRLSAREWKEQVW